MWQPSKINEEIYLSSTSRMQEGIVLAVTEGFVESMPRGVEVVISS